MSESVKGNPTRRFPWFFPTVQLASLVLAGYWWWHLPVPGYAVGVLSVLAAAMSIHTDMNKWQKSAWLLLIGSFLLLEFRAIQKDRTETAATEMSQRAEERNSFQKVLKQDEAHFEQVLQNNQSEFDTTIKNLKAVAKLSNEGVSEMTGGNAFAVVSPFLYPINGKNEFRLFATVQGGHRLSEVQIYLTQLPDPEFGTKKQFNDFLAGRTPGPIFAGTLNPTIGQELRQTITPSVADTTTYIIDVFARNKATVETLQVRIDGASKQWEYTYVIKREVKPGNPTHDSTMATISTVPWTKSVASSSLIQRTSN